MQNSTIPANAPLENDSEIWASLKSAIAASSGFKGWQQFDGKVICQGKNLDEQIRCYLSETLNTLAY